MLINASNSTPAAPAGRQNVQWQGDSGSPRNVSASIPNVGGVNAQTGTSYTVIASDQGKLVTFNNAGAVVVTLTTAPSLGNAFFCALENLGAGTATLTPAAGTINGVASLALATGQSATLYSDGSNFFAALGAASGGSGGGGITNPMTAAGDLIVGGTSGSPMRLALGSSGQVLGSNGSTATWVTPASSGGGGSTPPTSYLGAGGFGNRVGVIPVAVSSGFWAGDPSAWVCASNQSIGYFGADDLTGATVTWDFGDAPMVIDEATYTASGPANQGIWQFSASNDGTTFTNIGGTFTLTTAPQVITTLNGNTTGYRYYRMTGLSGTGNTGPWVWGMLFKIRFA
jgi:hypothetical protein